MLSGVRTTLAGSEERRVWFCFAGAITHARGVRRRRRRKAWPHRIAGAIRARWMRFARKTKNPHGGGFIGSTVLSGFGCGGRI